MCKINLIKPVYIIMWLSFLLLLSACHLFEAEPEPEPALSLEEVLTITNARRHDMTRLDPSDPAIYSMAANIRRVAPQSPELYETLPDGSISQEGAIADVEYLFAALWGTYLAYEHLGGDAAFHPARDSILRELSALDTITPPVMGDIINRYLSTVIVDNYFSMLWGSYSWTPTPNVYFFENGAAAFDLTENGFRSRDNNQYVASIEEYNMYMVFRLSMDAYGGFFYSPVIMHDYRRDYYVITVIYEDGSTEEIRLAEGRHSRQNRGDAVAGLTREYDIPVVYLTHMPFIANPGSRQFLDYGEDLRWEPVVVLDLRSNQGGATHLAAWWLQRLTGQVVPTSYLMIANYELTTVNRLAFMAPIEPSWVMERQRKLVLLVDRYTVSAGETFIDIALNLENTLIIGQNTAGSLITGDPNARLLPNSGITVNIPAGYQIFPAGVFEESVGYAPDIWVHEDVDTLSATIAMLRNSFIFYQEEI